MKNSAASKFSPEVADAQSIVEYGRGILMHEATAISSLANDLNQDFGHAVNAILKISPLGRLIVSGIGKTGFVAQKISATFASIGVPSFYMHPAEAVHGDLGRITDKDIALLLSNSGETPEVLQIVPGLKKLGCYIISLTSNASSLLAKRSNLTLTISKAAEAGPLGLAPTTSTTNMLALGDALAMTVSNLRPITREQFATFHPGGNLGRTLLPISDVMRRNEEVCILPENILGRDALQKITETKGRPGAAAIVSSDGKVSGVFTDGDLRRLLNKKVDFLNMPISEVMCRTPKTISASVLANDALKILSEYQIDQVFVVDDEGRPVGMVDIQDLVRWNTTGPAAAADY